MRKTVLVTILVAVMSLTGCARELIKPADLQAESKMELAKKIEPVIPANPHPETASMKPVIEPSINVLISVDVFFSPYDDCEKQWIETITKASSYVYVSCFGLTNANITKALCDKSKAGVKVILCTDKMQAGNKTAKIREQELRTAGAAYVIKKKQVLEHNKMIVVDDKYAIIGSWNLSGNAQPQDNSIAVFDNPYIANKVKNAIERIYVRDKE